MKKLRVFILLLGTLLLGACAASDSSETPVSSEIKGTRLLEFADILKIDSQSQAEGQKLDDSPGKDEKETRKGNGTPVPHQEQAENAPVKHQSGGDSQTPVAASGQNQDESAKKTEEPETPAEEPAAQPVEEPAVTQPPEPEPEPVVPEEPAVPEPEPEQPPAVQEVQKTIYDYAFDTNAIRAELIAIGQSMGLTHITEDDGIPCTPDTCSWAAPVTASESFQGESLKRALKDYVASMPSVITSYGGAQLTSFTIYVQDNGGGSYTFYFLY